MTPDPLKFVQMNSRYWEVWHDPTIPGDERVPNWMKLGYKIPGGCTLGPCQEQTNQAAANETEDYTCQVRRSFKGLINDYCACFLVVLLILYLFYVQFSIRS